MGTFLAQLLLPVLFVSFAISIIKSIPTIGDQPALDLSLDRYAAPNPENLDLTTIFSAPLNDQNMANALKWGIGGKWEDISGTNMVDEIADKIKDDMSGFNDDYLLAFDAKKMSHLTT